MSTSESDQEPSVKRKKGIINSETYKRNVIRNSRVNGSKYVNYNGHEIAAKAIPQEIICKCAKKCHLKVTGDIVKFIWDNFYSMGSKNIQDTYLQTLIESKQVKRRRVPPAQPGADENLSDTLAQDININSELFKKNHSYTYNLRVQGSFLPVCKNIFFKVHGISADRVRRLCFLLLQNKTPEDRRGKIHSGNALSGEICRKVH